jgi:hypothetical protein
MTYDDSPVVPTAPPQRKSSGLQYDDSPVAPATQATSPVARGIHYDDSPVLATPAPQRRTNVVPMPKQDQPPGWARAIERGIGTAGNLFNKAVAKAQYHPPPGARVDPSIAWGQQRQRNLADAAQWILQSPLGRGVDAVLGAGQRAEQSKIVEGDPLKGVFDPEGSLGVAHRGEQKVIAPALAALNQRLPGWAQGRMPNPVGPEQAGLDFVWQIGTDPQTQAAIAATLGAGIPVVGPLLAATAAVLDPIVLAKWGHEAAGGGKLLRAMSERVPEGMRTAVGKHIEKAKSGFSTSHDPLKGYTQPGLNLQRAEEGEQRFLQHHRLGEYHAAILPMEDEIHKLDAIMRERGLNSSDLATADGINRLPPAARRTLRRINAITDKALWREGTLDVRRSMKRRGFRPTAEEAKLAPTNLITKDFGKHYLPEQNIFDEAASKELKAARGWSYNRGGVKQSKFDIQKNEFAQPTDPLFERLGQRLEHSAYLEPKRRMEQTMIHKLGLHPSNAASTAERMEHLKTKLTLIPKADQLLARLSPEQRSAAEQMLAGEVDVVADPKVMSTVSRIQSANAQRQALEKHLGKYQTLFGKQAGEVAENEQRRAKYLRPEAPQTETKLPGVLRSHEEATARAVNQSRFLGKSLEAAFNDEGERLGHVNTGRASERAQNKTVEAGRARRDEEAVRKQLRKSETSRGKETARVEKAVETGKAQLSKQAEKGVDAAIKSDQNLTAGLKGVPGLNEQRQVGYARSGGGMLGEGLTGKIDGQSAIDAEAAAKAKKLHGQRGQVTPGGPNPKGEEPVGNATALRAALAGFQELEETQETRRLNIKNAAAHNEQLTEQKRENDSKRKNEDKELYARYTQAMQKQQLAYDQASVKGLPHQEVMDLYAQSSRYMKEAQALRKQSHEMSARHKEEQDAEREVIREAHRQWMQQGSEYAEGNARATELHAQIRALEAEEKAERKAQPKRASVARQQEQKKSSPQQSTPVSIIPTPEGADVNKDVEERMGSLLGSEAAAHLKQVADELEAQAKSSTSLEGQLAEQRRHASTQAPQREDPLDTKEIQAQRAAHAAAWERRGESDLDLSELEKSVPAVSQADRTRHGLPEALGGKKAPGRKVPGHQSPVANENPPQSGSAAHGLLQAAEQLAEKVKNMKQRIEEEKLILAKGQSPPEATGGKIGEILDAQAEKTAKPKRKPATKKAAKSPYQHVTPPAGEARHFFQPETQTLLNRKGEKLRVTIDPAYNALQRAARPTSINRPFQETASAVSRLGGHSTTKPLADIGERFSKNVAGRQKTALHAQQKQHELLKQNAAVEELNKRLEADPRYQASIPMPSAVNERLFGPKVYPEPHSLTDAGNAIRNAQFSFPFGHYFGNILDQQNLAGGGLGSVLAGALESAKIAMKDPAALRRLEQTQRKGATHIEGYESGLPELEGEDLLAKASRLPQKAQDALTIAEQGQASHLFHKYLEKGMSPEDAAEEVRKTFGRPHEHSTIVKSGTNAGFPFANWLLSTVPRSAKKMLSNRSASRSLEAYARATRDTNEDWLEPEYGVDWNPGGWVSRAAELGLALPTYMSSRSLESPLTSMGEESRIDPGEALSTVAPFVGPIRELTGQPLTENERLRGGFKELPWWMTGPSAMRGGYFRRAESQKHALLRELQRRGLL